ncbi:unnamed protein product [Alopecurus aequalis]
MSSSANRKRQPAIAAVSTDGMSPLASMYADLLQRVGWQLLSRDMSDYVRFRAVCRHWRSSTDCPSGRGIIDPRFHPRRWMMLPDGHGLHPTDGKKRFFNLTLGVFIRCRVPLLEDHRILCTVEGLLLLQRQDDDQDNAICLLHPFTGDVAMFPPVTYRVISLASAHYRSPEISHNLLPSSVTASLSVSADGVPMIMILLSDTRRVLFATTKDKQWSFSTWSVYPETNDCTISSQGKLYVLHNCKSSGELHIFKIDPPRHEMISRFTPYLFPPPKVIATCPSGKIHKPFKLVECDSEILLVDFSDPVVLSKPMVVVYRIADLMLERFVPLTNLKGNALLIDIERGMSVGFKVMPIIMGDTVVRRDPTCDTNLEQYHLGNGIWSSRAGGCQKRGDNGPCTCNLIHHIYGACHCVVNQ